MLYYKDLSDHLYKHKIEKLVMPLDESLQDFYMLRPSKFGDRLNHFGHLVHPFVQTTTLYGFEKIAKTYKRSVLIRWHLLLRLTLNPELIQLRKHRIVIKDVNKKKFMSKVKKVIQLNRVVSRLKSKNKEQITYI